MNTINKTTSFIFCLLLSMSAYSLKWDNHRKDMKRLVMLNHRALTSYSQARKFVMQKLHLNKDNWGYYVKDVYCNKRERRKIGPNKMPAHTLINVEHTWPQSKFNKSKTKSIQKADLHHLYPTNAIANSTRGNHNFGDVRYGDTVNSGCRFSRFGQMSSGDSLVFEPPKEHKGNVARALFYFSVRYDIDIPEFEEKVLLRWHRNDPVDQEERLRNEAIAKIQGNRNPFIDRPYNAELMMDF